ncbi:phosphate uptake regulator, PhoU [archaeon]|jgi:phosphate transport system protein|nr:phosphate uptake regulator, PhoU [archaeon]NHV06083.1 phosphate uptake regulator, PhoU [Nitrososphaerota archaeon]
MSRLIDQGIDNIMSLLDKMGNLAREAFLLSVNAYMENKDVSDELYKMSSEIRKMKDEVRDLAFELVLRYQPVARDLRFIESAIEISYRLSRFGRYAFDISGIQKAIGNRESCDLKDVKEALTIAEWMLTMSISTLKSWDEDLAKNIVKKDSELDAKFIEALKDVAMGKVKDTKCAVADMLVIRYLERIGDHATRIASLSSFINTGKYLF